MNPGEISIAPEYIGQFYGEENHGLWWDEYLKRSRYRGFEDDADFIEDKERAEEWRDYGRIGHGDALSDGNICWFRSEPKREKSDDETNRIGKTII